MYSTTSKVKYKTQYFPYFVLIESISFDPLNKRLLVTSECVIGDIKNGFGYDAEQGRTVFSAHW